MVKIRLSRAGAKKHPYYHIIAIDERKRRGWAAARRRLGTYRARQAPTRRSRSTSKASTHWVGEGRAAVSETVASLVKKGSPRCRGRSRAAESA